MTDTEKLKIEFVGDASIVRWKPGDTIVVSVERHLSPEAMSRIEQTAKRYFAGCEILVVSNDVKIGVMRKEEPAIDPSFAAWRESQGQPADAEPRKMAVDGLPERFTVNPEGDVIDLDTGKVVPDLTAQRSMGVGQ